MMSKRKPSKGDLVPSSSGSTSPRPGGGASSSAATSSSSSSRKLATTAAKKFVHEYWNELQYQVSRGDIESVQALLLKNPVGYDANMIAESTAVPRVTPLHIACRIGSTEMVKLLLPHCDINVVDQHGFSPLHYATVTRNKDLVMLLLSNGATASAESVNGSTAKDIAEQLKFEDIIDALESKTNLEKDPSLPMFRQWLNSLGAGEYLLRFVNAGYDLPFIAKHGLEDKDLDCVGIPSNKMGLRRKIMNLHELSKFYEAEEDEEVEEEEGDEEDEEEDEEDEDEEDED